MASTDTSLVSALPPPRLARPRRSFVSEDPQVRALNRIKGEGRRRIVGGLFAMNVPLSRIPTELLRENLTAADHAAIWRRSSWPLAGELLPDLLPGEIEEARLLWLLPKDDRVISLRARPHGSGATWRAVDDSGNRYSIPDPFTPWPVPDRAIVELLDRVESESLPYPLGALAACWEVARRLGLEWREARDQVLVRSISRTTALLDAVEDRYQTFWEGETNDEAAEEEVQ